MKDRVAEEMPISEVRKCSRLLSPVNGLVDQLHHCVMGAYMLMDVITIIISLIAKFELQTHYVHVHMWCVLYLC